MQSFLSMYVFTSHYVPIKSKGREIRKQQEKVFTSHYVPIKSEITGWTYSDGSLNLHPIMFLLNPSLTHPML